METLNVTFQGNQYVAVDYWWEDSNFIFVTDKGEKYCAANAYPISIEFGGLDYSSSEDCTIIQSSVKYEKNSNV